MKYAVPIQLLFALTFLAVTALGFFIPVKDDEIFYKLLNARLFTDGNVLISLFPVCKESFITSSPWTWLLPRGLEWLIYHDMENILGIRILGVAAHLALLALIVWMAWLLGIRSRLGLLGVMALLSLDTLPFLLDMNRPEQGIVLALAGLITLVLLTRRRLPSGYGAAILLLLLFILLVNFLFATHAKGVMFLPLVLVLGYYLGRQMKHIYAGAIAITVSTFLGIISLKTHILRSTCDSYPAAKALFSGFYIYPGEFLEYPLAFLLQAVVNLLLIPDYFLKLWDAPRSTRSYVWLPENLHSMPSFYSLLDSGFSLAVAGGALFLFCLLLNRARKLVMAAWQERAFLPEHAIGLVLLLCLLLIASLQSIKLFYEAAQFIPIFLMAGLLLTYQLAAVRPKPAQLLALILLAAVSQANLLFKYYPYATGPQGRSQDRIWEVDGGGLRQLIMVGTGDFLRTKAQVLAAAKACDIPTDASARHVMTDAASYSFFINSYRPLSILYLGGIWFGEDNQTQYAQLEALLSELRSSGMVTRCAATPEPVRQRMTRAGDFCCLKAAY